MARNVFGFGPMGVAPDAIPGDPKAKADALALRHNVPANVLLALKEAGSPDLDADAADLSATLKSGATLDQALGAKIKDPARASAVLNRAYDIADELYPRPAAPPPAGLDRFGKAIQVGDASAVISGQDFMRDLGAQAELSPAGRALTWAKNKLWGTAETPEERAQAVRSAPKSGVSQQAKKQIADIAASGYEPTNLSDIDSIGASVRFLTDNLGQSLPQMGVAIASGGMSLPISTVLLGAEVNDEMKRLTPDVPEDVRVRRAAGAGLAMAMLEQVGLGAIFGKTGATDIARAATTGQLRGLLEKRGIAGSAARIIEAGIVEGSTEAIQEGIVMGVTAASGGKYDASEVAERFATAFAAGGGVGSALRAGVEPFAQPPAAQNDPASALGAQQDPGADGSGDGQAAAPTPPPPGDGAAADQTDMGIPVSEPAPAAPTGPLSRAAAVAPDLTPEPEVPEAPPRFPDQKPGKPVRVADPQGRIWDAVFQRETPEGGAVLRIAGEEIVLDAVEFDGAVLQARMADDEAKMKATGKTVPDKAPTATPDDLARPPVQPGGLAAQAQAGIAPPAPPYAPEPAPKPGKAKASAPAPQPTTPAVADADGLYGMLFAAYEKGSLKDASGTADPILKVAKRVRDAGGALTRETFKPFAQEVAAVMERPQGERARLMNDIVKTYAGVKPDAAQTQTETSGAAVTAEPDAAGGAGDAGTVQGVQPVAGQSDAQPAVEGGIREERQPGSAPDGETGAGDLAQPVDQAALTEDIAKQWDGADNAARRSILRGSGTLKAVSGLSMDLAAKAQFSELPEVVRQRLTEAYARKEPDPPALGETEGQTNDGDSDVRSNEVPEEGGQGAAPAGGIGTGDQGGRAEDPETGSERDGGSSTDPGAAQAGDGDGAGSAPDQLTDPVTAAAAEADPDPTPAQAEAGNYRKGHIAWNGLDLTVETAKGSERRGVSADGQEWSVTMPAHYGYIRRTTGADGEQVDFYMGPRPDSDVVVVVDQVDAETGAFDEHKAMLGFRNRKAALDHYVLGFSDGKGKDRLGGHKIMTVAEFKEWLEGGDLKKPVSELRAAKPADTSPRPSRGEDGLIQISAPPRPDAGSFAAAIGDKANRPMKLDGLDFNAWDDKTREDGQMSPAKRQGRDETGRWAKALVKALTDAGRFTPSLDPKGKPVKAVAFGYGMAGELDETNIHLTAPNGLDLYVSMRNPMSRSKKLTLLVQFRGDPERPGYSRSFVGGNEYLDEDMTPAEAAAQIARWAEQRTPREKPVETPSTKWRTVTAAEAKAEGAADFAAGKMRRMPADINPMDSAVAAAWYRGWDEANLAAPVEPATDDAAPESIANLPADSFMPVASEIAALEAVGMVRGKADEIAWFRKQREQGGIASYKARAVRPGANWQWKLTRDFTPDSVTAPPTRQIGTFDTAAEAIAQLRENGMRTGVPEEAAPAPVAAVPAWDNPGRSLPEGYAIEVQDTDVFGFRTPNDKFIPWGRTFNKDKDAQAHGRDVVRMLDEIDRRATARTDMPFDDAAPAPAPPSAPGKGLKNLTEAENADLAALEAEFLDLLKNQTNSGLDPKMVAVAFKIGTLYVKAGTRRFRAMIDTMMDRLGLTLEQAQPYARNAYNQIRDDLELAGEDIADMDSSEEVVKEIRKMRAEAAKSGAKGSAVADAGDTIRPAAAPEAGNSTETGDDAGRDGGRGDAGLGNGTPGPGEAVGPDGPAGTGNGRRGDGDGRGGEPGDSGAGSPDGDAGRLSIPAAPPGDGQGLTRSGVSPGNFEITDDFRLGEGTPKQKIDGNLAAIRLVKDLDRENRYPTRDEQAALARYVGWGGLKGVFDGKNTLKSDMWGRAQQELRTYLTPDEYQNALFSVSNAHYTAKPVVDAMWRAMRHFGFEGGRALEPTVGTGNFLGAQPQDLAAKTEWFASELDPITSSIAAYLYPEATVLRATGFEKAPFRDGAFDIAIGNPPFGAETIRDKDRPDISGLSLHNYIIAKTGKHLRPGGIMAMVVTHRFLDTPNPQARNVLAKQFRFMGAVRLPSDAFLKNAGTEVTTDIVFFQKLAEGENPAPDAAWLDTDGRLPGDIRVNRYFAENPQNILGRSAMDGTMYGAAATQGEYTVHSDGRDLSVAIDEAVQRSMPADALGSRAHALEAAIAAEDTSGLPIGGMQMLPNGSIIRREMNRGISEITADSHWSEGAEEWDRLTKALTDLRDMLRKGKASPAEFMATQDAFFAAKDVAYRKGGRRAASPTKAEQAVYDIEDGLRRGDGAWQFDAQLAEITKAAQNRTLGDARFARLKGLLDLRRKTQALIRAEFADSPDIEAMRKDLDKAYDAFVEAHGYVNSGPNVAVLKGDTGAELGLEAEYSEAMKETVNGKTEIIEPEKATKSRILSSRVNRPKKDIVSASSPEDALVLSMQERGRVDLGYMAALLRDKGLAPEAVRDALSGGDEPRIFLDPETDQWTDAEEYLSGNVREKLLAARRAGLVANMRALEKAQPAPMPRERITPAIRSQWIPVEVFEAFLQDIGIDRPKVSVLSQAGMVTVDGIERNPTDYGRQFQNPHKSLLQMFTAAVNGKSLTVFDTIDKKPVKNEEATREVNAILTRMGKEFQTWAYADASRAESIVDAFNEKVNVFRRRTYDGEKYLKLVGANTGPNGIQLIRTQKNAAWRLIQQNKVLLDQVVGAGKTFTMVTGVMERRRLGLTKKALLAVPNHLVLQWARDWLQLYPGARLLAATKDDFEGPNRRRLFARMATGDYDAIIIGHSSLGFIAPPQQDVVDLMTAQVAELQDALDQARQSGEKGRTMNQLATKLKKYRERLERLLEKPRDTLGFDLAEMGVDYLGVDEAHEFKNLEYATGAERLVGMNDPQGSKRAFDLLVKTRGIQKRGGATHFATGTPVSNSLVEAYAMMKYLAWDDLEKLNISNFDAWSAAFVQAETRFEYTATQKLKERNVMSGLVNLGPLADLYRGFADVVDRQDLERIYAEQIREQNLDRQAQGLPLLSERFPTPHVKDGGRRLLSAPPSDLQELATDYYVARMAAIKKNAKDKEYARIDNPLWVLSDARKSSLDIRLLKAAAGEPRSPNSKVSRASTEIKRIYDKWDADKGTQIVFSDLSTPTKTAEKNAGKMIRDLAAIFWGADEVKAKMKAWGDLPYTDRWAKAVEAATSAIDDPLTDDDVREKVEAFLAGSDEAEGMMVTADTGFSVYDDLRAALVEKGIPEREIAFIHDFDTPEAKAKLFKRVKSGAVRVLIGSTPKMGAGTNVQERVVALHHIDSPWRPSDVEQREGRVIRRGNELYKADPDGFEVEILAYSTTGTSDVVLWQVLERKARSIGMFKAGAVDRLDEGDGDADSFAEFMATSTGNPVFRLKMQAEKALLEEGSRIAGALLAKSGAQNFLRGFDRSKADLEAAAARLEKIDPSALDYQGTGGTAAEFKTVLDQAKAKYDTEMAAFDAFRARVEARKIELAATGLSEGKVRAAITKEFGDEAKENQKPAKPGPLSDAVTAASGYARAIKKMLAEVDATTGDGQRVARLRDGTEVIVAYGPRTSIKAERLIQVYYRPPGQPNPRFVENTYSINASGSARILSYLMPDAIAEVKAGWLDQAKTRIAGMEAAKPEQERIAALDVDETTREEIRSTLDYYTMEVKLAEAKADVDRAKRGQNIFIMTDNSRPLDDLGSTAVQGTPTFAIDGDVWTGTGIGARVREMSESPALFEVTSEKTGQRALVVAKKEATGWVSERLVKPTPRATREMAAAKESRFGRAASNTIIGQDIRPLTTALTTEIRRHGLAGRITPVLVRSLINEAGIPIAGRQQGSTVTISAEVGDVKGVMRHEIIHVLRDPRLWDKPYGLFAEAEWKALVRAARSDKALMARVEAAYPDLPTAAKTEEAVAELYRAWANDREIEGPVARILGKIRRFLRAVAAALRGQGFVDAALVMERISRGEVGSRGPDGPQGPGGGARDARGASTDSAEFRRWFGDSKVVDAEGKPLVVYHGTTADFDAFDPDEAHSSFEGFWFTNDKYYAEWKARGGNSGSSRRDVRVMPVYLRMENPVVFDVLEEAKKTAEMIGEPEPENMEDAESILKGPDGYNAIADMVLAQNPDADGVIFRGTLDGYGNPTDQYALRDPTQIKSVFNRGTFDPTNPKISEMRLDLLRGRTDAIVGKAWKRTEASYWSDLLTTAMSGRGTGWNTLALVPGRALFAELGKNLMAAKAYLRGKEEMDALRNQWHARADETAQAWMTLRRADPRANDELMDLMHQTTLDGIDPSKPDTWEHAMAGPAERNIERLGDKADQWAIDTMKQVRQRRAAYASLKERYDALPKPFQDMYRKVRAEYDALGKDFERAVIDNIRIGMEIATKRAERAYAREMGRIRDEGLEGDEKKAAEAEALDKLNATKQRGGWAGKARMAALRQSFESNKLKGPYFPLARFGEFFVTERDQKGAVVSFSRFETAAEQRDYAAEAEARNPGRVQTGVMSNRDELKGSVDPRFVADVEALLSEAGAGAEVMDAVWQRWLETLPDRSIRNSRIHRKGREGFSKDAFRAFGKHMFHGAHQLAKLKYGLILEEHLNDAEDEARRAEDPSRAGLVVNEMRRRHDFTMNPTGSAAVASLSSLAFIWYLGASPAAAIANISQTTVVGIPVMAARFQKAGVTGVARALTRAARDFAQGRGSIETAKTLTADEVLAIKEALRRGTIDKTQAHDLASVAETGIEYNAGRERVMRLIGFFFHHAERFNREVTFMASYRLARAEGIGHADAIDAAADTTWKAHFDYQNCVDGETECLTVEGWKRWDTLREGDRIISTDDDGRAVEIGVQAVNVFHRPQQIALFKSKGPRRFSMAVTDNHKCVAMKEAKTGGVRGWTAPHFIEAQHLDQRHHLLRAPLVTIDRPDTIGRDMAALIGWFAAEGWYARNRGCKQKNNVRIEQSMAKNPAHVAEIDRILSRLGGGFSRQIVKGGRHVLWSLSGDLAKAVQRAVPDKLLPWSLVATLSAGEMDALLDAFIKGDGNRKASNGCITITQKSSTNRQNLEVLQAMATILGKTASLGESNTRDMVWLTMPGTGQIQTRKTAVRHLEQQRLSVPMVWCPTTDNGRWIARRNGCVFVTGNTSRPRIAQSDIGKILSQFKNFTINMLWRLFRDTHQALTGATAEDRKEARTQLIGITLSMMAHAGIRGVWGYGLLMMLLGMFFPGGSDDAEEKLQDALLLEGDTPGIAAWNWIMGAALNGLPGHVTGTDLTDRIGMPNLWFRSDNRDLEGADLYNHYVGEVLGPTFGIGEGIFRGVSMAADGEIWRGTEAAVPKVIRDLMKSARFATEGAETLRGDPIIEEMTPWQIVMQMNGFTPAQLAERYRINNRLKNEEARIMDERKSIHRAVGDAVRAGEPVSDTLLARIRDFNSRFPEYPITADTIRQSVQGQIRASDRNEFGIILNPKLNDRLRAEQPPPVYN